MTIAEFAKEKGITPQAVYKRVKKLGINLETIRKPDKTLTAEGLIALQRAFELSTVDTFQVVTVDNLKNQLKDMQHKVEMAEARAAAAENERDFLRTQLDNALKANALASMKRLEEPKQGLFNQLKTMFKRMAE